MKRQKRKILLFLDRCTVHNSLPTLSNVEFYSFPPNTTSKLQPLDQGIIHYLKTLYRKEIVKIVWESLDKQLTTNITILTTILLIDKAWRAVIPLTILNCFKNKTGFVKEDQDNSQIMMHDDKEPSMVPVVDISGVSFFDYVQVDEDVAVSGSLTDGEILSATDTNVKSNDEDDTSERLAEVSVKVARASFDNLQSFCLQNETDKTAYQALFLLKKIIDKSEQQQCASKQTRINELFSNIN
ncbi:tigger transposable element-derived protein 6-like [Anastrepha obliqua]|uniref:tigger transposable element-derived protein 6-like n=1 Tax=Anastrepha obliqua TaxID=95512 RepID=UPI00240A1AD8|nr:tigger transposable element-derived protein 6-like [Anastrepha obliqua]